MNGSRAVNNNVNNSAAGGYRYGHTRNTNGLAPAAGTQDNQAMTRKDAHEKAEMEAREAERAEEEAMEAKVREMAVSSTPNNSDSNMLTEQVCVALLYLSYDCRDGRSCA